MDMTFKGAYSGNLDFFFTDFFIEIEGPILPNGGFTDVDLNVINFNYYNREVISFECVATDFIYNDSILNCSSQEKILLV